MNDYSIALWNNPYSIQLVCNCIIRVSAVLECIESALTVYRGCVVAKVCLKY